MQNLNLYLAVFVLLLAACSPERRLTRLLDRNPHLLRSDTLTLVDTITVPQVRVDTVALLKPSDTLVLERERLKVQIVRRVDSVLVEAACEADTVVLTRTVKTKCPALPEPQPSRWYLWLLIGFAVAVALWVVVKVV